MNKRKNRAYSLIIIIAGIVMIFLSMAVCSFSIKKHLQSEMENTLKDITVQNVLAVNNEIRNHFNLLIGFSDRAGKSVKTGEEFLEEMDVFVKTYGFKRMGYAGVDGKAYTTDGYRGQVESEIFFRRGMEGKYWITAAVEDSIGDGAERVNVFSVPMYGDNGSEVTGVVFATYTNEIFQNMLDVEFFDGQGFSCIMKNDGEVMVRSRNSLMSDDSNFLDHIAEGGAKGEAVAREIRAAMQAGESGIGWCESGHDGEKSFLFYYMPIHKNLYESQWYMVSIAPESVLKQRTRPVMYDVRIFAVVMMVISALGLGFFLYMEKRRKEELESLAYEDRLTGGYNLAGFREKFKAMNGLPGYVVAMDLSEFKLINSSFGVQTGDETLLELWKILRESVSEPELVARVNADRFVLFLREKNQGDLEKRLEGIVARIEEIPGRLNIPTLFPVFGVYHTESLAEPDKCYGYAVEAKHLVKGRRDRHYAFYDEIDSEKLMFNRKLEDSFEEALAQGQFEVWYQPKYSAQEEKIIGAEALVRWRMPDGKLISPGIFIPLFEKNGSIAVLDEYIFRKVCEQQREWLLAGYDVLPVSVNISRVSLYFGDIVERYEQILHSYNLVSKYVQLEITESATIGNDEIAGLIERFHQAGFELLLDDFGSGYSSLASLNTLHFDTLKLDKSLIDYIGDEKGEKLLKYIAKLGQSLGLHITAEGVENKEQLAFLKDLKCNDIQGYYFSKPLPMEEYETLSFSD